MIHLATIRAIADEAVLQITMGCRAYQGGDFLMGDLHMSMAQQALLKLQRLLDVETPPQKPPLRRLVVVGPRDEELPEWMNRKTGEPDGAA